MKILSAAQIREADGFTIKNEPVSSFDLMQRASQRCFEWIVENIKTGSSYSIICSTGNNGGDGLCIAKLLAESKLSTEVFILDSGNDKSEDFNRSLEAAKGTGVKISYLKDGVKLSIAGNTIIIDAIFGTGLSRPVTGWLADCINSINESGNQVISIDLPSGLSADSRINGSVVCANHSLTFQSPKLAFMFAENEKYVGDFHIIDIGLHKKFIDEISSDKLYFTNQDAKSLLKPRSKFSHKGIYGRSLLISGSKGKIGAAVLAARSCLRTGTGLLTVHIPQCGYDILQTTVPEAMIETDYQNEHVSEINRTEEYDAIGIGPGIGIHEETSKMFGELLNRFQKPMVIDADALNIISLNKNYLDKIPANSILTPHPKEFERFAGKSENDFDRHQMQIKFSQKYKLYVVLKGAHTCITTPEGLSFFNSTGNPGMAKGGSGDALTGMILALLSQNYSPLNASILGVYLHGLAGDFASIEKGIYAMICSDIIEAIPAAFKMLQ